MPDEWASRVSGFFARPTGRATGLGVDIGDVELDGWKLDGVKLFEMRVSGAPCELVGPELPLTYSRTYPMVVVWACRRRLVFLMRRPRSRAWLARRGLAQSWLAINYEYETRRSVPQIINTIRVS